MWRIDFTDRPPLVLKYFDDDAFVAESPDRVDHEATALRLLSSTPVPVPTVVAQDPDGSGAGAPAVLMTLVPGARTVPVPDPTAAAAVLAAIHRVEREVPWVYERYNPRGTAGIPEWGDAALWSEAVAAVDKSDPGSPSAFIHRDFHHHNIVWSGGVVSGVVDWLSSCLGPPGIDIARFRLNTLLDGHPHVGDSFARDYRSIGIEDAEDPHWDLVDAIDLLPWYVSGDAAVTEWPGTGEDPGDRDLIEDWVRSALRRL